RFVRIVSLFAASPEQVLERRPFLANANAKLLEGLNVGIVPGEGHLGSGLNRRSQEPGSIGFGQNARRAEQGETPGEPRPMALQDFADFAVEFTPAAEATVGKEPLPGGQNDRLR